MTPREFAAYWAENNLGKKYSEAQSEEQKMRILESFGLGEYKEEAERQIWLKEILKEWATEEAKKPAPQNLKEGIDRLQEFKLHLMLLGVRDYEIAPLMWGYFSAIAVSCYRDGVITKEEFVDFLEKMGISSEK